MPATLLKKEALPQVLSCEFCEPSIDTLKERDVVAVAGAALRSQKSYKGKW